MTDMRSDCLTKFEWDGIDNTHNLADGHARGDLPDAAYIAKLPSIFENARTHDQRGCENEFSRQFFGNAGQTSVVSEERPVYFHYSSSVSIEVVANICRIRKYRVGLLHPTFDNIPDILKRHEVPLVPVAEDDLTDGLSLDWSAFDFLFLVTPNNPTGWDPSPSLILELAQACQEHNVVLCIDFSFRLFSSHLATLDLYRELETLGVSYIGIEDVGKTWPLLDLKLGAIVCSDSMRADVSRITDEILLNVSPFIFGALSAFGAEKASTIARKLSERNRGALHEALSESDARCVPAAPQMSIAWIQLPRGWDCFELCGWLSPRGVSVLPGAPFFWHDRSLGTNFIRVALMRSPDAFDLAVQALAKLLREYADAEKEEA